MTDHDDDVLARAAKLPREVCPPRDLWPGIEAGIRRAQARPRGLPWSARAAAAVTLMAISSLTTWALMRGHLAEAPAQVAEASFGASHVMGPGFIKARDELAARVTTSLDRLSPETRTVVLGNLTEIRRSIAAINEALEREPSNASLQQLLYSTYQQELSVLREVSRLDETGFEGVST